MDMDFMNDPAWMQEVLGAGNVGLWAIVIDNEAQKYEMYANDTMLTLLGLSKHPDPEQCYAHWYNRIDEKYIAYVTNCVNQIIETGKLLEVQYPWKHPELGSIFVRCGGRAECLEDGRIQVKGYHQNINEVELLKREQQLRNEELEEIKHQRKTYNALFDSVLCGIVNYKRENDKLIFKKVNQEALRIFNYTKEEFQAKKEWNIAELIAREDIQIYLNSTMHFKEVGDKASHELRLRTKTGEKIWVIERTERILDTDGDEVFQSVFIDNNENKKKTVILEKITENIPGGVCLIDLDTGNIIYGNEGFYHLYGCTEEELRKDYDRKVQAFLYKEDQHHFNKIIEEAMVTGQRNIVYECKIRRHDDSEMWVLVKGTILNNHRNRQLSCVLLDITDRKEMERKLLLNERRLNIALEQMANTVFDFDVKAGKVNLKNGDFGLSLPKEEVACTIDDLVHMGVLHEDSKESFESLWKQIKAGAELASKEVLIRYRQEDSYTWTKAALRTIYRENGSPQLAIGILEDISKQKEAEQAYKKEEQYRQAMLADTLAYGEINVTKDIVEKVSGLWAQSDSEELLHYDELFKITLENRVYSLDRALYENSFSREAYFKAYNTGLHEISCEYRRVDADGKVRWMLQTIHFLKEADTGDLKAIIYLKDIDDKKQEALKMRYRAEHDSLTELYNKGTAEHLMSRFLQEETAENESHAFIILDIDHFKNINDSYGHQYGDEVLKSVAAVLKETFRSDDIKGRLGGDEMVVLMKYVSSKQLVAEKLKLIARRLAEIERDGKPLTVSIGVSFFRENGSNYQELYKAADIALYQVKENGRNGYKFYEAL